MGLNIIVGCMRHRERVWIYRGCEGEAVAGFYRKHWDCQREDWRNVRISDDQSGDVWTDDPSWRAYTVDVEPDGNGRAWSKP